MTLFQHVRPGRLTVAIMFVFALVALQFAGVKFASAATLTWDGSAGDSLFSTAANWSTNSVPVTGDVITFTPLAGGTEYQSIYLTNDLVGVAFGGIVQTASSSDLSKQFYIDTITFAADAVISNSGSGSKNASVYFGTVSSNGTIIAQGNLTSSTYLSGVLTVAGNLISTNYILALTGSTFGGNVTTPNGFFGDGVTIVGILTLQNDTSGLLFDQSTGTIDTDMSIGSASAYALNQIGFGACATPQGGGGAGGGAYVVELPCGTYATTTITLSGSITLNANVIVHVAQNATVNITGTVISNGHTITLEPSSEGFLNVGGSGVVIQDTVSAHEGDQASTDVTVRSRETATLSGVRGSISVTNGGVLKGTGTATIVSVASGAIVMPGNSPGKLTVLQSYFQTGEYRPELLNKDTYDQLAIGADYVGPGGNAVILNSGATLNTVLYDGWVVNQGDQFRIINNLSSTAVSGTFTGLTEGTQFTITSEGVNIVFSISYVGGDGNDVVLTAINAGKDPTPPNTGVMQIVMANPLIIAGLGIVTAAVFIYAATRRNQTN